MMGAAPQTRRIGPLEVSAVGLGCNNFGRRLHLAGTRSVVGAALDAGITTLVDWSHNNNSPEHADAAIQGVFDSGIRSIWACGNSNDEWLPVSDVAQSRDVVRIAERWVSSGESRVSLALAPRGPQFATQAVTLEDFALAGEFADERLEPFVDIGGFQQLLARLRGK